MTELLLDPSIRTWVFVPIVIITFLVGILRHYIFLLFLGKKKGDLQSVKDGYFFNFLKEFFQNFFSQAFIDEGKTFERKWTLFAFKFFWNEKTLAS